MKCALVTGGSAAVCLAICHSFLDAGYEAISIDRRPGPIENARLRTIVADLSDTAATEHAARRATRLPVTTLVRNARAIRIVLISSRAALGLATRSAYSATKGG